MWQNLRNILVLLVLWSSVMPTAPILAATVAQPPPANLLINGGFEEGAYGASANPTGWFKEAVNLATANFTWDNTVAHSGSKSVKINLAELNDARWVQFVNLQPNTDYEFSGWIKTQGVPFMNQRIDQGANLSTSAAFLLPASHGLFGVNDWTFVSFNFNSANWTGLSFFARIGYYSGTAVGTAWFDDLQLVPITRSVDPRSLLWNGSFEQGGFFAPFASPYGWNMDRQGQVVMTWETDSAYWGTRSTKLICPDYCGSHRDQRVAVQPNTNYLLSGWIKTEGVGHTIQTVDAGANLSVAGTWRYTPPLFGTNDWTYVSLLFNSGNRSQIDVQTRVGYDSGVTRGTAWFDGLQLRPLSANMVNNPDFALGANPWIFFTNGQGLFTTPAKDGSGDLAAKIEINQKSTNTQLYQKQLFLEPQTRYRLQFMAYSNSGRDFTVDLDQHPSAKSYGLRSYRPNLTNAWKTFVIDFTTKGFTQPVFDGRLRFIFNKLAKPGDVYWIDNLSLKKVETVTAATEAVALTTGSVGGILQGVATLVTITVADLETGGTAYQATTVTDGSGYFQFTDLPTGAYELTVQAPLGYLAPEPIVFTSEDALTDLEISLEQTASTIFLPQIAR